MNIREVLFENKDEKYADFSAKLSPNLDRSCFIGVRIPVLRELAKKLAKGDVTFDVEYYEEKMLQGMIIGYSKLSIEEYMTKLDEFVPTIDSWGICDSVCSTLKFTKKYQAQMLDYIMKYKNCSEYEIRFMLVMLMDYYLNDEYIDRVLEISSNIKSDKYYINMANAWLVATALAKHYDKTVLLLENSILDKWTHNKAIQKARESYRITAEQKEYLNTLKIK